MPFLFDPPLSGLAIGYVRQPSGLVTRPIRLVLREAAAETLGVTCYELHELAAWAHREAFYQRAFSWPEHFMRVVYARTIEPENDLARELISSALAANRLLREDP